MKFLEQYRDKMNAMNGVVDSNGMASLGAQQLNQKTMQNMLTAHHINPEAGASDIPFTEPSLEDLVDMVKQGKIGKEVLGDDADTLLQYGTPSQRKEKFDATGSMEIPVIPFPAEPRKRDTREGPDEDDLAFLKDFINKKA
tara:strand:+ start:607 stop:1029 length:423 start_codon:yes stop_codon:yes gene_type:complete